MAQLPEAGSFIAPPSGKHDWHMTTDETPREGAEPEPEDHPDAPGAEGGTSAADTKTPFSPHEDDGSDLGDTDQHSDA